MNEQEFVYLSREAEAFYIRNKDFIESSSSMRSTKKTILNMLEANISFGDNCRVLEIGCCIGDLLNALKTRHGADVVGIEPAKSACNYARKKFGLEIENTIFNMSHLYGLKKENKASFDLIILDDVLCWFSRELILPSLASIDWLLRPNGHIFIRDFSPSYTYSFRNHHQINQEVYNFKLKNGHSSLFLDSGMYCTVAESRIRTSDYQEKVTQRLDSTIWADVILTKLEKHSYPVLQS